MNFSLNLSALSTANVAGVLAAWTTLCAMVSLANRWFIAPHFPLAGKTINAVLNILPGHLGQLITDVQAIIADIKNPPAAPPATPSASAPITPETPATPPANNRLIGFAGAAFLFAFQTLAFSVATEGCGGTLPAVVVPPSAPADVTGAVECITTALLSGASLQPCIDKYGQALINDAIQTLLDSKEFAAAHPDAYSTLRVHAAQNAQ